MPLLADYAITPDVFDVTSYSSDEVCAARLETIREAMLTEGLVRNLQDGEWSRLFRPGDRSWHRRGTELVKKLSQQGRLIRHGPALADSPRDDPGWCAEALASHDALPLAGGVIVTGLVKKAFAAEAMVSSIDRLSSAPWWAARSSSVTLQRTTADYLKHLEPVLRCSNSILFIDPHLDPARRGYRDIGALLARSGNRSPAPRIEIHRVCYEGSGPGRHFPLEGDSTYFERRFRDGLGKPLRAAGSPCRGLHLGRLPRPVSDQQPGGHLAAERLRYRRRPQGHAVDPPRQNRPRRRSTRVRRGERTAHPARKIHHPVEAGRYLRTLPR